VTLALLALLGACGSSGGFPDAPPPLPAPHPGTFALTWSLASSGGGAVTCAQANATKMVVAITDASSGAEFSQAFDCTLGDAVSGGLTPATYNLTFSLTNATGAIATTAPQAGLAIQSDHTTVVAPLAFTIP